MFSIINLPSVFLGLLAIAQFGVTLPDGGCPEAYPDTGQTDVPLVMWNGVGVSGGGTLSFCQTRSRCTVICNATSQFSPSFYINETCYTVTEKIGEGKIDGAHPMFVFTFDCPTVRSFRCVYSESSYSPEYILQENSTDSCGDTPPTPTTEVTTTNSPGTTVPSNTTEPDLPGAIAAVVVVAVGVVIGLLVTICVIIYTCCRQKRRRNNASSSSPPVHRASVHDSTTNIPGTPPDASSFTMVATGNTTPVHSQDPSSQDGSSAGGDQSGPSSSSVSDDPDSKPSEGRGDGDGGEEVDAPYPISSENDPAIGDTQLVTGYKVSPIMQNVAHSSGSQLS